MLIGCDRHENLVRQISKFLEHPWNDVPWFVFRTELQLACCGGGIFLGASVTGNLTLTFLGTKACFLKRKEHVKNGKV